ncbi:hypothetical protein GGF31_001241 [Allomyces arbusculus]|nr:hypothetical protein GGF31_001241 [Allomyces arbusculus]
MSPTPPAPNALPSCSSLACSDDSIATLATTPSFNSMHEAPTANVPPAETYERARWLYTHLPHARADAQELAVVHWRLTPTSLITMVVGDTPDDPVQEIVLETDELVWRRDAPYGIEFAVPVANTDRGAGNGGSAEATTASTPTSSTGTVAADSNDEYHGAVPVFAVYSEDTREIELWFALLQSHRATRPLRPATATLTAASLHFAVPPYEDHAIVRLYDAFADPTAPPLPPTNSMAADVDHPAVADPTTRVASAGSCDFLDVCDSLELAPSIITSRRASIAASTHAITSRRASIAASTHAITSRRASFAASTDAIASRRASVASSAVTAASTLFVLDAATATARRASIGAVPAVRAAAAAAAALRRASTGASCVPAARAAAAALRRASLRDDLIEAVRGSRGMLDARDSLEMVAARALQAGAMKGETGTGVGARNVDAIMEVESGAERATESVDSVIARVPVAMMQGGIPETAATDLDATFVSPAMPAAPKVLVDVPRALPGEMPARNVVV